MKINFDWHNYMSKNKDKTSQSLEGALDNEKKAKKSQLTHKSAFVDISDEVTDNFKYGDQGKVAESLNAAMGNEEYLAVQRDFMTVMSNSMSASDFQKMKEEGFDVSKMEPEQAVTILDKIKTVLALHCMVWTAQRCSQSYTEKGRKETEVARSIKGEIKRRETYPASNQFPKCFPPSGTHKEIHRGG